jgi:hypothetical protein
VFARSCSPALTVSVNLPELTRTGDSPARARAPKVIAAAAPQAASET